MVTKSKLLKINIYPRKSRRRQKLSWSSRNAFLLNCFSSEREILNEERWYLQRELPIGFGLKMRALPIKKQEKTLTPRVFGSSRVPTPCSGCMSVHLEPCSRCMTSFLHALGTWHVLQVHGAAFQAQFLRFSVILGLRFQITCTGTWEQNSSDCKIS